MIPGFHQRLLASVKPKKMPFNACMRKLLTIPSGMAKRAQHWNPHVIKA